MWLPLTLVGFAHAAATALLLAPHRARGRTLTIERAAALLVVGGAIAAGIAFLAGGAGSDRPGAAPAPGNAVIGREPNDVPSALGGARIDRDVLPTAPDAFGPTRTTLAAMTAGRSPEVVPVAAMLWALAADERSTLASCFTASAQRQIGVVGWPVYVVRTREQFHRAIGALDSGPLTFSFDGDSERGAVTVARGSRALPSFRVVREPGRWLVAKP